MVTLRAYPRLHIGLLDLGRATPRIYGGAGFALDGPFSEISASPAAITTVGGAESLDDPARADIDLLIERFQCRVPGINWEINFSALPMQHVGLGSKTALSLGLLQAMNLASNAGLTDSDLQMMSGRGGTSGIGINTFFQGGFLIDLGHPNEGFSGVHLPSSAHQPLAPPMIGCRTDIAPGWDFHLVLAEGFRLCGSRERDFFKNATPIPSHEVFECIAVVYHGILPAVFGANLDVLSTSLNRLHDIGLKRKELEAQAGVVCEAYAELRSLTDCAVGLSSLGPLLYVVAEHGNTRLKSTIVDICERSKSVSYLGTWGGRNNGYEVICA